MRDSSASSDDERMTSAVSSRLIGKEEVHRSILLRSESGPTRKAEAPGNPGASDCTQSNRLVGTALAVLPCGERTMSAVLSTQHEVGRPTDACQDTGQLIYVRFVTT